jgi:competence protein ComEA
MDVLCSLRERMLPRTRSVQNTATRGASGTLVSAPPPARAVFASSRSAQAALVAFLVCVVGLVAYRTYSPRLNARPTDDPTSPVVTAAPKPIDLNAADRAELEQLPGVGPSLAEAILSHRREAGPFRSVDELGGVHGVGDKTLAKLRPLLTVSEPGVEKLERKPTPPAVVPTAAGKIQPGEPPLNVNTATEVELQRLPRVGPVTARAIVSARPFRSVDDLDRVKGIGKKTVDSLRPFVTVE